MGRELTIDKDSSKVGKYERHDFETDVDETAEWIAMIRMYVLKPY